ncbi:hypothetical protein D3C76_1569600 [compost metagenome]
MEQLTNRKGAGSEPEPDVKASGWFVPLCNAVEVTFQQIQHEVPPAAKLWPQTLHVPCVISLCKPECGRFLRQ